MDIYVYVDGLGGRIAYRSMLQFIKSGRSSELGVSERTLRQRMRDVGYCSLRGMPSRYVFRCELEDVVRKKVRPKYLFGKPY